MESMPQKKDNDGLSQGMGYDLALTRPWSFDDITQSTYTPQHFGSSQHPISQTGSAP
jgi:hypothetical protein